MDGGRVFALFRVGLGEVGERCSSDWERAGGGEAGRLSIFPVVGTCMGGIAVDAGGDLSVSTGRSSK